MFRPPRTDFWQVGIVPAPLAEIDAARLRALRERITWLPDAGPWRYLADPFGLERDGRLHVFVEAFDYRDKHGRIERHEFERESLRWLGARTVLSRPFHLSYPQVFEHGGETWMVPESHRADEVALYRATDASLDRWQRECALLSGLPVADASLIEQGGLWWMFYSLVGPQRRDQRELHAAWAPALTGPWTPLAANPIHVDPAGARPAGRPFTGADGRLRLPVQDGSGGYGSATRLLRLRRLSPEGIDIEPEPTRLTGDLVSDVYGDGLHTLSGCGELSLIDVKRIDRSRGRQWLDLKRRLRRLAGR